MLLGKFRFPLGFLNPKEEDGEEGRKRAKQFESRWCRGWQGWKEAKALGRAHLGDKKKKTRDWRDGRTRVQFPAPTCQLTASTVPGAPSPLASLETQTHTYNINKNK